MEGVALLLPSGTSHWDDLVLMRGREARLHLLRRPLEGARRPSGNAQDFLERGEATEARRGERPALAPGTGSGKF